VGILKGHKRGEGNASFIIAAIPGLFA
jgi:hypothetical protein